MQNNTDQTPESKGNRKQERDELAKQVFIALCQYGGSAGADFRAKAAFRAADAFLDERGEQP